MSNRPCLLVMAGGTGGHIFPGLAVARALQKKGWDIHWLGTRAGLEAVLIPQANIPINYLSIAGLFGKKWFNWCIAPIRILTAFLQASLVLWKVKPSVVLGMGGFVAGPGGLAAWVFRYPLLIHDQNAVASVTNRCLAPLAKRVMVAFPDVLPAKKAVYVGNPVREEITTLPLPKLRFEDRNGSLRLLILGGSRGARAINECVPKAIVALPAHHFEIWHQAGKDLLSETKALYTKHQVTARVEPFIEDMSSAYAWADVVICRAGALTIAELTAAGVGSILIPFPFAVNDHQTHNARWLTESGAGILLPQSALTAERLAELLHTLTIDRHKLLEMADAARRLAMPDAVEKIVNHCIEVSHA